MTDLVSHADLAKDLGRLEGTVLALGRTVDQNKDTAAAGLARVEAKLDSITEALQKLQTQQDKVRGGISALGLLLSAAALVGGFIAWALDHVIIK